MEYDELKILAIGSKADTEALAVMITDTNPKALVYTAPDVETAGKTIREHEPDAIVIDITGTETTLQDMCMELKHLSKNGNSCIILRAEDTVKKKNGVHAMDIGAKAILSKTADRDELAALLDFLTLYKERLTREITAEDPPHSDIQKGMADNDTPSAYRQGDKSVSGKDDMEIETEKNSKLFRTMFDNMPDAACILKVLNQGENGSDYIILDMNRAGLQEEGRRIGEITGKSALELLGSEDCGQLLPLLRQALSANRQPPLKEKLYLNSARNFLFKVSAIRLSQDRIGIIYSNVTQQEAIRRQLEESERNYWDITSNISDIVFRCDAKMIFTYVSPSMERITGHGPDYFLGRSIDLFLQGESAKEVNKAFLEELVDVKQYGANGRSPRAHEIEYKTESGGIIWLSLHISVVRDVEATPNGIQGIARDITAKKLAEAKLRESEEKYRLLFESMSQGVIYRSADGTIVSVNAAAERIIGYSACDLIGAKWLPSALVLFKEDGTVLPEEKHPARLALETKKTNGPCILSLKHGQTQNRVWLSITSVPIFRNGSDDPFQVYTINEDITVRKNTESALIHSRDLMRYVIEHDRSAVAVFDREMRYLFVSQQYLDEATIRDQDIIGKCHYDVQPNIPQKWRDIHNRALLGEVISDEEDPFIDAGGSPQWNRWECRPWYDADGSIGGIILYTEIITKRKQMEEHLRISEEKYRIIAENVSDVIWVFNPDRDRLTYISPSVIRLTGYNAEDILEMNGGKAQEDDPFSISRERVAAAVQELKGSSSAAKTLLFECRRTLKDGSVIWTEDSYTARFNAGGETEVFGVSRDIIARKENEETLRFLSYHDQLTGLYNRRFFEEELARLDTPRNYPLSLIMGDINGLKIVNDSFSHEAGDELLKKGADVFRKACRSDDIIARLGGDEFIIILPKTGPEKTEEIMSRMKSLMSGEKVRDIDLSISFGTGTKDSEDMNIREVLANVENQMYRHKLYERMSMRSATVSLIMNALFAKSSRELLHSKRVGALCRAIATHLNYTQEDVNRISTAGLLHDIGKIGVDEKILNKSGSLTLEEWPEIHKHPETGWRILSATVDFSELARFILQHQEQWDGNGYPKGLKAQEICREARIIKIADAFDAMTSERPYRQGLSLEEAAEELKNNSGKQFDPEIVEVFLQKVLPEAEKVK